MLNKDLFYALCEKYEVVLSDKVDKPMIIIDGKMEELTEDVAQEQFQEIIQNKHK